MRAPIWALSSGGGLRRSSNPCNPFWGQRRVDLKYSNKFKSAMIHRLSGNKAISAHALSKEVGVPQATLSTWLRDASVVGLEVSQKATNGFLETVSHHMTNTAKRPKEWTTEQKLQAVLEASQLSEEAFGAFLRKMDFTKATSNSGVSRCSEV